MNHKSSRDGHDLDQDNAVPARLGERAGGRLRGELHPSARLSMTGRPADVRPAAARAACQRQPGGVACDANARSGDHGIGGATYAARRWSPPWKSKTSLSAKTQLAQRTGERHGEAPGLLALGKKRRNKAGRPRAEANPDMGTPEHT